MVKSGEKITLNNGNKRHTGRSGPNKVTKEIEMIGEENCISLYQLHLDLANNCPDLNIKCRSQQFLLARIMPIKSPTPPARHINLPLIDMIDIEDIRKNQDIILKHMRQGNISLEETQMLFGVTAEYRKTYEDCELAKKLEELSDRMTDKGM